MSCRGPANHNSVALLLPHKAMISFLGGAIGADIHNDRAGIHCRSITDSAKVLDALKDPRTAITTRVTCSRRCRGRASSMDPSQRLRPHLARPDRSRASASV